MTTKTDLYPLSFDPIYKEKVWGGRSFESLNRTLPGNESNGIGESWEIADLATTSVSGGGGNAEYSVVTHGPLKGQSIRQLMQQFGQSLLGPGVTPSDDGGFPLLIKFLDAKENLSVQVHPSPAYAAAHEDAYLKSEAWYIIDHEPGAVIYKGLKPGVTPEMLRTALETNTDEAVVPLLNAIEVKKGDCHYLPSGTLHALGAGVLVAEVQTPSDTTYRVYDWGRTDRELHIEQAMACIDFSEQADSDAAAVPQSNEGIRVTEKATCDFFSIQEYAADGPATASDLKLRSAEVWMSMKGDAKLVSSSGEATPICAGQTLLLPAMLGKVTFNAETPGRWLRVTLP
jgi:mannose-6-phosphate isomerase